MLFLIHPRFMGEMNPFAGRETSSKRTQTSNRRLGFLVDVKVHQVAEGDQFLPEWSNPTGTLLGKKVAEVD